MVKTKFKSIEELFIHVLEQYEEAETACIWEVSGNIAKAEEKLQTEIECYKSEFERLTGSTLAEIKSDRKMTEWER